MILKFAGFALFVAGSFAWAKPSLYRLSVATPDGKISEQVLDLLERSLNGIEISVIKSRERYARQPHLPVPVCDRAEYYLFSPGEELLAIGCVSAAFPALAVPEVTNAVKRYEAAVKAGRNPTLLTLRPRR
jgi:hypothetical protein